MKRFAVIALLSVRLVLAADPFVGTWEPNPAKWKSDARPDNANRTLTIKWQAVGQDHYRTTQYTPDGKHRMGSDGKADTRFRPFLRWETTHPRNRHGHRAAPQRK